MPATSARMVPDMALAWFELPSALNSICSPFFSTATLGSAERAMVPSGPFTEMLPAAMVTSTPLGSATGYFAILDMAALGDDAEHFAADAVGARLAVGHHAARGRQDRDAEPVHHARDVVASLVDAQPRLRHALETLDHRPAGVVLEADSELFLRAAVFVALIAGFVADGEVLDVALVLQYLCDRGLQLGGRHRHFRVPNQLGIADADQHVRDRVAHAHALLLTSSP